MASLTVLYKGQQVLYMQTDQVTINTSTSSAPAVGQAYYDHTCNCYGIMGFLDQNYLPGELGHAE